MNNYFVFLFIIFLLGPFRTNVDIKTQPAHVTNNVTITTI